MKAKRAAPPPNTCILYARVSTDGQEKEGTSLESQEAACRLHAERLGWAVVDTVQDTKSGATLDRPKLERARELLRDGKAAALVVYAVDRLTREQNHIGILLDEAERYGYTLEVVTEKLDETPAGKFLLAARAFAAEVERGKIRERSIRGKRGKLQQGKIVGAGSEDPYGYRLNRDSWRHEIVEAEAVVVRRAFALCAVERYGVREIARRLHAEGHRTRHGKVWRSRNVWRLLRSPLYKGVTIAWRWQKNPRTGLNLVRPVEEQIILPDGVTPPLVSPDLWQQAQTALDTNRGEHQRNRSRPVLLRGMVWCGYCDRRCYCRVAHGYDRFQCAGNDTVDRQCRAKAIHGPTLNRVVWAELRAVLADDALIDAAAARWRAEQPQVDRGRLVATRLELGQVEEAQARLLRAFTSLQGIATDLFTREMERLERQRTTLTGSIADLQAQEAMAVWYQEMAGVVDRREWRATWMEELDATDFAGQRAALESLALRVMLRDDEIDITGSLPVAVVPRTSIGSQQFGAVLPFRVTVARPQKAA